MSKFLGPIHYWVYNKILFQEKICTNFINFALNNNIEQLKDVNEKFPGVKQGNLEDIIDTSNIHGWLSSQIELEEKRLAYIISVLIEEYYGEMLFISKKLGEENSIEKGLSPEEVYQKIDEYFINGMPCDRINEIIENENGKKISWRLSKEIHEQYLLPYNIPVEYYYNIRLSIMLGMIEKSDNRLLFEDGVYTITKE